MYKVKMSETDAIGFGDQEKRRLVKELVLGYYNGSLKPDLAEKNPNTGRDVEYLMDGPQFERIRRAEVWSFCDAVGTGYQYRVVYKDRRFSALERLLEVYSGSVMSTEEDRSSAELSIYRLALQLVKEGRVPKAFMVRGAGRQEEKLAARIDELTASMKELEERVRSIERQLVSSPFGSPQDSSPTPDDISSV